MRDVACTLFAAALFVGFPLQAASQVSSDGTLRVEDTWARMAPNESGTASVFFEVLSSGAESDELLYATSTEADTVVLRRGKWRGYNFFNRKINTIKIRAGKRTSFHPGAYEVTLTDFTGPISIRSRLPITLVFKNAGLVNIEAIVSNQLLGNRIKK
jgi:periplasmic copper chaperone A